MLLASVCKTQEQVGAFSTLIILVMCAVGGSMLPREFMPAWLRSIGAFTFNGWAMDGFNSIFWRDMTISGILPECAVMAGIALVLTALSMSLFSRKMAL
jgi:ABC-2 type transport system permease protein